MKLYEYLASGLAVVSRETAVISENRPAGIFTYLGSGDADEALRRAMVSPSPNMAGAQLASQAGWREKALTLLDFVERVRLRTSG
jgi:hypothetical protein